MQSTVLRPGVPSKSAVAVRIARVLCSHALGWGKHTHRNECAFWNVAVELEIGKTIGITTQTYAMVKARKFQLVERVSFVRPVRFSTEQGMDGNGVGSGCVRFSNSRKRFEMQTMDMGRGSDFIRVFAIAAQK